MKQLIPFLVGALLSMNAFSDNSTQKGIIGESTIDGNSVIYKFTDELPNPEVRSTLPWLVVISWRYDGASVGCNILHLITLVASVSF